LPLTVLPIPGRGRLISDYHPFPRLYVAQAGYGRRWYRRGGSTKALYTAPRMIELYEKGLAFDEEVWEGEPGRCVLVEFNDQDVQELTGGELRSLNLATRQELFDDSIARRVLELAHEALDGMPNGALHAQGLCLSLVDAPMARYTRGGSGEGYCARTLTRAQQRKLAELFRHYLGENLSLARMAAEVNLCPLHFGRLFKASYSITPHEHLQVMRIDAAVKALRCDRDMSIAAIALTCGFASQSHMTEVIRRSLGATPSAVRRAAP
jgi:AraC family transcriptional regulator